MIQVGKEARESLLKGVNILADTVTTNSRGASIYY